MFNEPVCKDWCDWSNRSSHLGLNELSVVATHKAQIIFYLSRKYLIGFDVKPWIVIWEEDNHRGVD